MKMETNKISRLISKEEKGNVAVLTNFAGFLLQTKTLLKLKCFSSKNESQQNKDIVLATDGGSRGARGLLF